MMRRLLLTFSLLCAGQAMAAEAGRVVFVAGQAQVAARAAVLEGAVQEGDELVTGRDGYIYMKTVDNGFLILRPNSRARVIAYKVDARNPANTQVKLELMSGVARSISGNAVKNARQNFRFNTPVAAIGVRGTDFIVHTNAQNTWVSVVSGGVVMSGFAGACGPEGTGPCEGATSRELFAGHADSMLQLKRGQDVPQLLNNSIIAPELNAPARPDEPVGKAAPGAPDAVAAGNSQGSAALKDIALDPAKNALPVVGKNGNGNGNGNLPVPDPGTLPPVLMPPVLPVGPVTPVEVVNGPPEIIWGRWESVAGAAPDAEIIALAGSKAYTRPITVGSYVLARPVATSLVLPREGTAAFNLAASDATMKKIDGPSIAAQVDNGRLAIDFGARTFTTSLQVSSSLGTVNLNASGSVTQTGALEGALFSGTTVRGYLGGALAGEAVYGFKTNDTTALSAQGITRWSR